MDIYQRFGTINRTILRQRPWWPVDWQSLPPRGWCAYCGAEVYRPGREVCSRCEKELRVES